jgi:hypothetical protein
MQRLAKMPKMYELKDGESITADANAAAKKKKNKSLAERLEQEDLNDMVERKDGHQMVFKSQKSRKQLQSEEAERQHRQERQEVRRSASSLQKKRIAPKFWDGKRVN